MGRLGRFPGCRRSCRGPDSPIAAISRRRRSFSSSVGIARIFWNSSSSHQRLFKRIVDEIEHGAALRADGMVLRHAGLQADRMEQPLAQFLDPGAHVRDSGLIYSAVQHPLAAVIARLGLTRTRPGCGSPRTRACSRGSGGGGRRHRSSRAAGTSASASCRRVAAPSAPVPATRAAFPSTAPLSASGPCQFCSSARMRIGGLCRNRGLK